MEVDTIDFNRLFEDIQHRKIYVYGYGVVGQWTEQNLKQLGVSVCRITFWDNDLARHRPSSATQAGVKLPSLNTLSQADKENALFFIAIDNLFSELYDEMQKAGCCNIYHARILPFAATPWIGEDLKLFIDSTTDNEFVVDYNKLSPAVNDIHGNAGKPFCHRDVLQNLWAAKKIYSAKPEVHYDIGSSTNEFICHLLSFQQKVVLIDIRPLGLEYMPEGLCFIQEDATELNGIESESIDSISAICSIEHFGLGRYGDPINPNAHVLAFHSLQRVVKSGGNIYLSLPISRNNEVWFNEKRSYSPHWLIVCFDKCQLCELSLAIDNFGLVENLSADEAVTVREKHDLVYGLYHFIKK